MDIVNTILTFGIPGSILFGLANNWRTRRRRWLESMDYDELLVADISEKERQRELAKFVWVDDRGESDEQEISNGRAAIDGRVQPLANFGLLPVEKYGPVVSEVSKVSERNNVSVQGSITLSKTVEYLNDKRDDVPHWFCKGGTGSGKSTFIRLALAYRIARGEQFVIMTGKRSKVFTDIPCIGRDALKSGSGEENWKITYNDVARMCRQLLIELQKRDHTPIDQRSGWSVINIVIDDASLILSELPEAMALFRNVGLLGRELDMRLVVATGSLLVKELGLEGRSDLRDHFAVVTYNKKVDGSRETLLRPRYDDPVSLSFDSSPVPVLSEQSYINPDQVWKPSKTDFEYLEEINGDWEPSEDVDTDESFRGSRIGFREDSASGRQRKSFRVSFSPEDTARVAARIAKGEKQSQVVTSMPGYRGDRHAAFVAEYEKIKQWCEGDTK